ncbi:MAG: glycosyltransferase family 39 protein [Bryobacteraceae bacterium]
MILDRQLDVPPARSSTLNGWRAHLKSSAVRNNTAPFLLLFAIVVALQLASGAYHAEFSGYPDEPAHYVTSLMVHDYITALKPVAPMKFALNFYYHYPKVAFGHWPPFFYLVQALWMSLFSVSRASVRLEVAFTTALLGFAVWREARNWFGWKAGVLAAILTVCLPVVQIYTDEEMAETLLVFLCFLSAIYFARYLDSEQWRDCCWFGVFFALAVLTKGNGWLLALMPPVALVLTRKLRVLSRPSFWLAVLLIAAACIPWQWTTMQLADRGWEGGSRPNLLYTMSALKQFVPVIIAMLGPILSVLIGIGIVVRVLAPMFRKPVPSAPAVMLALILAVWIFHSLVPAGVEDRKMMIALPALVLFLFAGGFWIANRLPLARWRNGLVALAGALVFSLQAFAIPHVRHYGFIEAARFITSDKALHPATILVSSESGGEGLLISEVAMHERRPGSVVVRGTKALAEVDWNGSNYHSKFSSADQIVEFLKSRHVDFVVLDTFAPEAHFLHNDLLRTAAEQSNHLHLIATFPAASSAVKGQIQIYRFE